MRKTAPSNLLPALLGLVALLLATPARPDDPGAAGTVVLPPPGSTQPVGDVAVQRMDLSLRDAIAMGLENNLNIEIQRHAPLIAHEDAKIAWGSYDPEAFYDFTYANIETPTANILLSGSPVGQTKNESYTGEGGLRGLIPWLGSSYEFSVSGDRTTSDVAVQLLSPEYDSSVNFVLTQPLMRGLIWNEPWTAVKTTQILEHSSMDEFRRDLMDLVQGIENAYWALIADDERVRVAEKSLETRRALLDQVETQFEVGVVSKVEIAQAEAGVAQGEFDLIVAQNRYQTSMDNLIDAVLGPKLHPDSRIEIVPTDRPDEYTTYHIDPEEAAAIAYQYRPEIDIADRNIERLEINLKLAKNQRLPRLDAVGSYGNQGLSGKQRPDFCDAPFAPPGCDALPPVDLGGLGDSYNDFLTSKVPQQYTVGAIFSFPLGNVSGRHGVSKADLELRRAHTQKRRVIQDVVLQIRKAVRDIDSAQGGIVAAQRQEDAAAEQLRAERIKLEYGESTPFDVLQREEVLVEAEQGLISAFQTYRSSITFLDRSQGTILRNRNISIDAAGRLR